MDKPTSYTFTGNAIEAARVARLAVDTEGVARVDMLNKYDTVIYAKPDADIDKICELINGELSKLA